MVLYHTYLGRESDVSHVHRIRNGDTRVEIDAAGSLEMRTTEREKERARGALLQIHPRSFRTQTKGARIHII